MIAVNFYIEEYTPKRTLEEAVAYIFCEEAFLICFNIIA